MDEYSALAQRVAMTMDDVRGCLLLSRDGLVLGAYPEDGESSLKPSWLKFIALGDARRSFVEFGEQTWAFIHRGPYAAFVVAGASVRPGVLLDQLEQALLVAEEARAQRGTLKVPDAAAAPSGKPRTSLHPPADRQTADAIAETPAVPAAASAAAEPPAAPPEGAVPTQTMQEPANAEAAPFGANPFAEFAEGVVEPEDPADEAPAEPEPAKVPEAPQTSFPKTRQKLVGEAESAPESPGEIDRVMLAKEFSGLLQLDADTDEDSS